MKHEVKKTFSRGRRLIKIVAVNALLLVVLTELMSLGFYFIRTRRLFYLRPAGGTDEAAVLALDETRLERTIIERLHPYFGFTTKPETPYKLSFSQTEHKANNYGFTTPYAYPFKKRAGQYVVGIFGGSVAQNYAVYEQEHNVLAEALKQLPALRDKEIIILPFAYGGYKQPQQLLALNYFLALGQGFDLVINIDGFNEVALSDLNTKAGVEVAMPSVQHIMPLVNLASGHESTEELTSLLRLKQYKERLKTALQAWRQCTLASCYTLRLLHVRYLAAAYRQEVGKYDAFWVRKFNDLDQDALVQVNRDDSLPPDSPAAFEHMAFVWAESSRIMRHELADAHVPYFHIVQPNQYAPTQRVFGEEEKRVAIQADGRYVAGVRGGYPVLLSKIDELRKSGVTVINAVNVFDHTAAPVYSDTCCHYNQLGSEIFSTFVAGSIVTGLKEHLAE
jgi:hypothetical protein